MAGRASRSFVSSAILLPAFRAFEKVANGDEIAIQRGGGVRLLGVLLEERAKCVLVFAEGCGIDWDLIRFLAHRSQQLLFVRLQLGTARHRRSERQTPLQRRTLAVKSQGLDLRHAQIAGKTLEKLLIS